MGFLYTIIKIVGHEIMFGPLLLLINLELSLSFFINEYLDSKLAKNDNLDYKNDKLLI